MIKSNASGSISGVGYKPGQLIDLVRNPNWNAKTSWRPAYADQVLFKEGFQDPTVQARTILSGGADANGDTPPPPAELQVDPRQPLAARGSSTFTPTGGSRYVALNTSKPPFDNVARPPGRRVRARPQRDAADARRRDRRPDRDALHRPELREERLHAGRRLLVRPVPERRLRRERRQGEGADATGRLRERHVLGAADHDGRGQRRRRARTPRRSSPAASPRSAST